MQKKELQLILAAKSNDYFNLSKVLTKIEKAKTKGKSKSFVDINSKTCDGITALHYAAKHGNIEMIEVLLSRGAFVDVTDKNGWRPISYASANNHSEAVCRLIERGGKLNVTDEDNSPLHIAAKMGHRDIVKILMENGADIHNQNKLHQTPVDVACENNHYGIVNVLLSASSKLIEEFSENSFKSMARKSLNPAIMRTTTLPSAISSSNIIDNGFSYWADNIPNSLELKSQTNGSQEQLPYSDRFNFQSFRSYTSKKSGSLNTIFLQDEEKTKCDQPENEFGMNSLKCNRLESSVKSGTMDIILPYPSKFSTSDVLRIKSPLLPLKSAQKQDSNNLYKGVQKQTSFDDQLLMANGNRERNIIGENIISPRAATEQMFKFRKDRRQFQNTRVTNKPSRSSLPLQSHFRVNPGSPTHSFSQEPKSDERTVYGKPPTIKFKDLRQTQLDRSGIRNRNTNNVNAYQIGEDHRVEVVSGTRSDNVGVSCQRWIKSIGLLMIWDSLINDGFDSFLALSLATDEELFQLCNNRIDHLSVLKTELDMLNIPSMQQLIFSSDIQQILTQLGLEEYCSNFIHEGYHYISHLPKISERLLNNLAIVKRGHRRLLLECFQSMVKSRVAPKVRNPSYRSVSSLSQEIASEVSVSPVDFAVFKEARSKCNSLPRFSLYNQDAVKKSPPPPIPPRSCSIPNESFGEDMTLDDILSESMCQSTASPRKKGYCASKCAEGDLANLDDLVNMLTNLGNGIDIELNVTK